MADAFDDWCDAVEDDPFAAFDFPETPVPTNSAQFARFLRVFAADHTPPDEGLVHFAVLEYLDANPDEVLRFPEHHELLIETLVYFASIHGDETGAAALRVTARLGSIPAISKVCEEIRSHFTRRGEPFGVLDAIEADPDLAGAALTPLFASIENQASKQLVWDAEHIAGAAGICRLAKRMLAAGAQLPDLSLVAEADLRRILEGAAEATPSADERRSIQQFLAARTGH